MAHNFNPIFHAKTGDFLFMACSQCGTRDEKSQAEAPCPHAPQPSDNKPAKKKDSPSKRNSQQINANDLSLIAELLCESGVVLRVRTDKDNWQTYETSEDVLKFFRSAWTGGTGFKATEKSKEAKQQLNLCQILRGKPENEAQQKISSQREFLGAIDSSDSSIAMFDMPRELGGVSNFYPASAKIDFVSAKGAAVLEIKVTKNAKACTHLIEADVLLLIQSLKRIFVMRSTNAALREFVVLGATGRSAWVFKFSRCLNSFNNKNADTPFESVSIMRVPHAHLWDVWFTYQDYSRTDPHWYLTEDGPHILSALASITNPAFCATKLLESSQHRVYAVSLPRKVDYQEISGKNASEHGVCLNNPNFCMKVVNAEDEFEVEATVGKKVCKTFNEKYPQSKFHVIGFHYMSQLDTTTASAKNEKMLESVEENYLQYKNIQAGKEDNDYIVQQRASLSHKRSWDDSYEEKESSNISTDAANKKQRTIDHEASVEAWDKIFSGSRTASTNRSTEPKIDSPEIRESLMKAVEKAQGFIKHILPCRSPTITHFRAYSSKDPCVWRQVPTLHESTQGGVVLMHLGQYHDIRMQNFAAWSSGVIRTLNVLHECGFVHTDIRPRNVLFFGKEYQLIDFGCALLPQKGTGGHQLTYSKGGRYNARPESLRDVQIGQTVSWTPSLDMQMVLTCLGRELE